LKTGSTGPCRAWRRKSNGAPGIASRIHGCRWCCVKRGFANKPPRHTLKGRQDVEAVERSGLRLQLMKQQALAGDIVLLFANESEALTHPYLARAWAKRGADLRVEAANLRLDVHKKDQ
jgi:hypothetical protein